MFCVVMHLTPGLPPIEQLAAQRMTAFAHDAGCGMYPGQRRLAGDCGISRDTLRVHRDRLLGRPFLERLPRAGPRGADLYRLVLCAACQPDFDPSQCAQCRKQNLLHDESEWAAANPVSGRTYSSADPRVSGLICSPLNPDRRDGQRAGGLAQNSKRVQGEPAATPDHLDGQAAPGDHRQPADNPDPEPGTTERAATRAAPRDVDLRGASKVTPAPPLPATTPAPPLPRRVRADLDSVDRELAGSRW
jgi:hypothetical protein